MKLIPNWRKAHRMLTVQLGVAFTGWGLLSPEAQAAVLEFLHVPAHRVPAVLGLLVIVGRLVAQASVQAPKR